ncbi:histone-lysine N-methyltransferase SMYD3 [Tachysurus ichikawai]
MMFIILHLVTWTQGHMVTVTWTRGHMVTWTQGQGLMVTWTRGHMVTWTGTHGHVDTGTHGHVDTGTHGDTWSRGHGDTWSRSRGHTVTWTQGHGHVDTGTRLVNVTEPVAESQRSNVLFKMERFFSPEKGNGLRAAREIKAGQMIYSTEPFVFCVSEKSLNSTCQSCLSK